MRPILAGLLMMITANTALAQPTNSIVHEMTTIGKPKDELRGQMPPIENKQGGQMFTIVGGGVNVEGTEAGANGITVLDDGGPATKAAPSPKAEIAKPAARETSMWDDFMSNFDGTEAKPAPKAAAVAPVMAPAKPTSPVAPKVEAAKPAAMPAPKLEAIKPAAAAPTAAPAAKPAKEEKETDLWDDIGSLFDNDDSAKTPN